MRNPIPTLAIVNPFAGRGRAAKRWPKIRGQFPGQIDEYSTTGAGDAERRAHAAIGEGFKFIISVGGDGTLHEVVNGILSGGGYGIVLGVVSLGTANDFVEGVVLTGEGHVADRPWRRELIIDVGVVDAGGRKRYFCNALGIGLPARVALRSSRIRVLKGRSSYLAALLGSIAFDMSLSRLKWRVDDQPPSEDLTLAVCIASGPRQGSFVLAADAKMTDGMLDVLRVGPMGGRKLLSYLPRILLGRIPKNDPLVSVFRCLMIEIESIDAPVVLHLDGEMFASPEDECLRLKVNIQPACLRVFVY